MMLEAMTLGSSHTDSMKKICAQTNNTVQISSLSRWGGNSTPSVAAMMLALKSFSAPKLRIMLRLSLVVFVASKTWKEQQNVM